MRSPLVSPGPSSGRSRTGWWLALLIACRLVLLVFAPHTDTSEARYAEISRKMVETGDWITPQFSYGVPFWAKPPLSMWMSAAGMEVFGTNEFGSRILIFAAAIAVLALVAWMARREWDAATGWTAATLLMAMPLFFYCSAAVMTDLPLLLGTTLAMTGFRSCLVERSRLHGYLFFLGLGMGLLAKGPLALVMAAAPVFLWTAATRQWKRVLRDIPWASGTVLMLAISVPWYLAAEHKTPGFLDYFLLGEHWKRFTVKGWKGDLYGNAHAVAPGMVWVYWLLGAFPWVLGLFSIPRTKWRNAWKWALAGDGIGLYLALWMIWPVLFFTAARNIIPTYPLPALPATALLLARVPCFHLAPARRDRLLRLACGGVCGLFVAWSLAITLLWPNRSPKTSEREIVRRYQQERQGGDSLLYYGFRRYSAEFYLGGAVDHTVSVEEIESKRSLPGRLFLVVPTLYMPLLPAELQSHFQPVSRHGSETLYVEKSGDSTFARHDSPPLASSGH